MLNSKSLCQFLRIGNRIERRYASGSVGAKASKLLFYSLTATTIGTGGAGAYAYYDPEFRKFLESQLPPTKIVFTTLFDTDDKLPLKPKLKVADNKKIPSKQNEPDTLRSIAQPNPTFDLESKIREKDDIAKIVEEILDKKLVSLTESQKFEISNKVTIARSEFEKELKEELSRQNASHAQHEEEMLRSQRESLNIQTKKEVQQALMKERREYAEKLASAVSQLTALEIFLNGRSEFDGQNRRAKKLWISCQRLRSLLNETRYISENSSGVVSKRPLDAVILDIKRAGESDDFVQDLLKTVPDQALKSGVYTDEDLVERYDKVKKLCRRLARVRDRNAGLMQYFLSYLQSLVIFDSEKPTSGSTLIDLEKSSTYDLLSRTSFCLKKKDYESAIKLMSLLKGESAKVASDWLDDLRLHVETRQLADLLIAHASAQSIRSLY